MVNWIETPHASPAAQASTLTLLKDDPGSSLEVFLGGSDGGQEFLVGAVDVWVGDQVIVESSVDAGFCPLFSSCQRDKDVGSMTVHQPVQASAQDRTEQEHWTLIFCLSLFFF